MKLVSRKLRGDSSELMYLLDSTSLTLKGREFDRWTLDNSTRNTQGMKVHVLLDATTLSPDWYLSVDRLHRHEPHIWARHGFANGGGVIGIVLATRALHPVRRNNLGGHEIGRMTELKQSARQMVRAAARLHADDAGRQLRKQIE